MSFVILNIDKDTNKIQEFAANTSKKSEIFTSLVQAKQEQINHNQNNIFEVAANIIGSKINNLGIIEGTKDNKLVELKIFNLKKENNEQKRKFINNLTDYALKSLKAETLVVFSLEQDKFLEELGYESLGKENDVIIYLKDRYKSESIGGKNVNSAK